jgi:RNA polymerase sigma-70 factor (ECF subfamily)
VLLPRTKPFRLTNVATLTEQKPKPRTLSEARKVRYSVVVKTTEAALPADQNVVDLDNTDQLIIQRVLGGNRDAFKTLIQRYSDPLYRHALCMTGSPDVAEDILQLSFIKAYQHLAEVRGRFDAWVFRIVAIGCKDWLKNIRRSHLSYDEDDQPSSYATPDEELDRTELRSDLDRALSTLPASLREAFVMKHVEGRSYEEMADLLGTTVGALKMRVHRARCHPCGRSLPEVHHPTTRAPPARARGHDPDDLAGLPDRRADALSQCVALADGRRTRRGRRRSGDRLPLGVLFL